MRLPVMPPVAPMLAKVARGIPEGQLYEPKWDGFRSIVFRDGDEVEIGSRNERPMTRYFPELVAAIREGLPPRCVIDGEIVVASPEDEGGRLDFWSLQQRIHPAASRVELLAERTPASFVAFDLLALDDRSWMDEPFEARREALAGVVADVGPRVHLTPITRDEGLAQEWFERFEGAGLDGLIAKSRTLTYQPNKRVMTKVKHERTADCVVAGYRVHKSDPEAVGSLLLGLYDDPESSLLPAEVREWFGNAPDSAGPVGPAGPAGPADTSGPLLVSVGVVGAFPMAVRRQLFVELQPLVVDFADHPWSWAADLVREGRDRQAPGSRWNASKDLSFVPLRPERVVEVRYDYMEGFRFRHTAQFHRWRPDRTPESCGYGQLDRPTPLPLAEILGHVGP